MEQYSEDSVEDEPQINLAATARLQMISVAAKDAATAGSLIRSMADVNYQNERGCTPLHLAVQCNRGNLPFVRELLNNGADITLLNSDGHWAADLCSNKAVASALVDKLNNLLVSAIRRNDMAKFEQLRVLLLGTATLRMDNFSGDVSTPTSAKSSRGKSASPQKRRLASSGPGSPAGRNNRERTSQADMLLREALRANSMSEELAEAVVETLAYYVGQDDASVHKWLDAWHLRRKRNRSLTAKGGGHITGQLTTMLMSPHCVQDPRLLGEALMAIDSTPVLHSAVRFGNVSMARALIRYQANPNIIGADKTTVAADLACSRAMFAVLQSSSATSSVSVGDISVDTSSPTGSSALAGNTGSEERMRTLQEAEGCDRLFDYFSVVHMNYKMRRAQIMFRCPSVNHPDFELERKLALFMCCPISFLTGDDAPPFRIFSTMLYRQADLPSVYISSLCFLPEHNSEGDQTNPDSDAVSGRSACTSICILSRFPHLSSHEWLLKGIYDRIINRRAPQKNLASHFSKLVYQTNARGVQNINTGGRTLNFDFAMMGEWPCVDPGCFYCLFSCLTPDSVCTILGQLIIGHSVLLLSETIEMLLPISLALAALCFPFRLTHVHIPYLPRNMVRYVLSPVPFFMGTLVGNMQAVMDTVKFTSVYLEHNRIVPPISADERSRAEEAELPAPIRKELLQTMSKAVPEQFRDVCFRKTIFKDLSGSVSVWKQLELCRINIPMLREACLVAMTQLLEGLDVRFMRRSVIGKFDPTLLKPVPEPSRAFVAAMVAGQVWTTFVDEYLCRVPMPHHREAELLVFERYRLCHASAKRLGKKFTDRDGMSETEDEWTDVEETESESESDSFAEPSPASKDALPPQPPSKLVPSKIGFASSGNSMLDKVRARIARHKARLNDAKTQRRIGESTSPSNFSTLPPAREDPIVEDEDDGDIPTDALMLRMRIRKLLGGHADSPVSDPPSDSSAEGEDEANGADDASTNINRGSSSILSALKVNVDADLNTAADADPESDSDDVDNSDGSAGEDEVSGTRAGDQNGSAAAALPDTDSHEESFTESETDVSDDESEENWQSRSHRTCRSWFRAMRQMQDKLEELQRHSDAMALKREADADQPTADDQQFPTRTQILSHCFTLAEERAQQEEDEERKARRSNRLSSSPLSTAQVSV